MFNECSMTTTPRGRRAQAQLRRDQLVEAALAVFAEHGFEHTTIRQLAERAGVAQGLLYHYFRSKDDLLRAALERQYFMPELQRITSPDRDRPAAHVLLEVAAGFQRMLEQRRELVQVMLQQSATNAAVAERLERGRNAGEHLLAEYLSSRVAAGELRPHDSRAIARLLLYTLVMAHLSGTASDAFRATIVDTVLHGIASARP
jgi:AcrR family transcriptional regulator